MPAREVILYPDRRLKEIARPAQPDEQQRIGQDLVDTMRSFPRCVGLAAPQIGEPVRMIVVDCTGHPKVPEPSGLLVLANPRVVESDGVAIGREGCLLLHEIDHLDGVLFLDRVASLADDVFRRKNYG